MDEHRKKAFDFASDVAKQLITLSTGIIAVSVTFSKDIVKNTANSKYAIILMAVGSFIYLLSILAGLWHLYALTGELETIQNDHEPTTRGSNATIPAITQIITFLAATLVIIIFGIVSMS
jgi:hypothetical protein